MDLNQQRICLPKKRGSNNNNRIHFRYPGASDWKEQILDLEKMKLEDIPGICRSSKNIKAFQNIMRCKSLFMSFSFSASGSSTGKRCTGRTHKKNKLFHTEQVSYRSNCGSSEYCCNSQLSERCPPHIYLLEKLWICSICTHQQEQKNFSSSATNGVRNTSTFFKAINEDKTIQCTVRIWPGGSQIDIKCIIIYTNLLLATSGVLTAELTTQLCMSIWFNTYCI